MFKATPLLLLLASACDELPATEGEPVAAPPAPTVAEAGGAAAAPGPDGPDHLAVPDMGTPSADEAVIAAGQALFDAKGCSGCHTFGSKLVGPDLTGVTTRRTIPWITRMIRHPDAMTKEDPVAKDLFRTHMTQMPNQGVSDEELAPLVAFLHSKQ